MERRRVERRTPDSAEPLSRFRLRAGREVSVVDVSDGGALVEGARLLPGTHVDVHVTTRDGRVLVRSCVVRAYIAGLQSSVVCYRGALAFERMVDTSSGDGYRMPEPLILNQGEKGSDYPVSATPISSPIDDRVSA